MHPGIVMRPMLAALAVVSALSSSPASGVMTDFTAVTIQHDGLHRHAWVYVPDSAKAGVAAGIVFFFHGLMTSVEKTCGGRNAFGFPAVEQANLHNFIAVCPQGFVLGDNATPVVTAGGARERGGGRGWNNAACCGYAAGRVDDVGFVSALLARLRATTLADLGAAAQSAATKNVFAFGFSTGGLFSYRLACDLESEFAGIAPTGAVFNWGFTSFFEGQMPWADACETQVPVWSSLGTNDVFTSAEVGLSKWRQFSSSQLGCDAASEELSAVGSSVNCYSNFDCAKGAKSRLCVYTGATHSVQPLGAPPFEYPHTNHAWLFLAPAATGASTTAEDKSSLAGETNTTADAKTTATLGDNTSVKPAETSMSIATAPGTSVCAAVMMLALVSTAGRDE
mmetsp:Transcript_54144/g.150639  ORF Transcript_54144/g.150639 Transcript_54144/m.150639 type:complete len:395 (+) Transcript_54144:59-1243(+)